MIRETFMKNFNPRNFFRLDFRVWFQILKTTALGTFSLAFLLVSAGNAQSVFWYATPENYAEMKTRFQPGENAVVQAEGVVLPDWDNATEKDYPQIWNRLTDDFRSQFSMKRGYPLGESELALLFAPESVLEKGEFSEEFKYKREKIRRDVDRTLHEIHYERFLVPLRSWCQEKKTPLELLVSVSDSLPLAFVFEDLLLVRRTACRENDFVSDFIAASGARQCGALVYRRGKELLPTGELARKSALLLSENGLCGDLKFFPDAQDVLTESQILYASVLADGKETCFGSGPMRWNTLILAGNFEEYLPQTQAFVQRFQGQGGTVVQKMRK